ncbi:MAG: dihydrofolate reductase family protein [Candidatus Thermoplasmatota archaeon]|nr:dihydrofolate reductase family protein [Candidatus Thermoplasmatota archaeon]
MGRPFIHMNCASSFDGKIASPDGSRLRISGPWDVERVHRLRADIGAILVGAGTIITDDPKLTIKDDLIENAPSLTKVVLDGAGRIPAASRFLRTAGRSIVITSSLCDRKWYMGMQETAVREDLDLVIIEMETGSTRLDIPSVLTALFDRGIERILVEGGSEVIWEFVRSGCFDRFTIYFAPILVGGKGPSIMGGSGFTDPPQRLIVKSLTMTPDGGVLSELILNDQ